MASNGLIVQSDIGKHLTSSCIDIEVIQKGEELGEIGRTMRNYLREQDTCIAALLQSY